MGGNDGLNTVIPYADSKYPQVRSRIGIPVGTVLPLDSRLGLNPQMTGLKSLWDAKRVAVVENVGYPNSSLSHFASRDIWHTADPTLEQHRGWLGRWADATIAGNGNPLSCTAISSVASAHAARRQRPGPLVPDARDVFLPDRRRVAG